MASARQIDAGRRVLHYYDSATTAQRTEGRQWYRRAFIVLRGIARRHGHDVERVAYAASALSPLTRWDVNVRAVAEMAARTTYARPFGIRFGKQARDAWSVLHDGELAACSGPKREAFARALTGDREAVVLDRWMARAMGYEGTAFRPRHYGEYTAVIHACARLRYEWPRDMQAIVWVVLREYGEQLSLPAKWY